MALETIPKPGLTLVFLCEYGPMASIKIDLTLHVAACNVKGRIHRFDNMLSENKML